MVATILGSFLIGLSVVNLYFVFDAKQCLLDLYFLFMAGFTGSYGLAWLISGIKEQWGVKLQQM